MANSIYLERYGTNQGLISEDAGTEDCVGFIYQDGHEDQIFVQSFAHNLSIPTDMQSGQPTGLRQHGPITFSKPI